MPTYTTGKPSAPQLHVEPGDYKLKVIEATDEKSQASNPQIKLKLRVIREDGSDGPALFDYLVFTSSAYWKIDAFLKACGQHPGEGANVDVTPEMVIGWECEATLKVDTYEGKKNNKVATYLWEDEF